MTVNFIQYCNFSTRYPGHLLSWCFVTFHGIQDFCQYNKVWHQLSGTVFFTAELLHWAEEDAEAKPNSCLLGFSLLYGLHTAVDILDLIFLNKKDKNPTDKVYVSCLCSENWVSSSNKWMYIVSFFQDQFLK